MLLVAAALAAPGRGLDRATLGLVLGISTALLLVLGRDQPVGQCLGLGAVDLGSYQINYLSLAGNVAARSCWRSSELMELVRARTRTMRSAGRRQVDAAAGSSGDRPRPSLSDLAVLAFVASLVFMALEMVAGRLVQRHLGSSIYGWTSVIGVLLAGLSLGNFLGRQDRRLRQERETGELALPGCVDLQLERPVPRDPTQVVRRHFLGGDGKSLLSQAISLSKLELGR